MGLPLLDAMVPAFSVLVKTAAKPVHRFQAIYPPNGMAMEYWTPTAEGRGMKGRYSLSPRRRKRATPGPKRCCTASPADAMAGIPRPASSSTIRAGYLDPRPPAVVVARTSAAPYSDWIRRLAEAGPGPRRYSIPLAAPTGFGRSRSSFEKMAPCMELLRLAGGLALVPYS